VDADDAVNYGARHTIGHEMTHGFDSEDGSSDGEATARLVDAAGCKEFEARAQKL